MRLRSYQNEAVDSIWGYFQSGKKGNPIVAMPTGVGKSLVIGGFAQSVLYQYPQQKIVVATHVKELIEQNFNKLLNLWPSAPAGIYSAGLKRKDVNARVTFGGIQSMHKNTEAFAGTDLLLIDECHLVSEKQDTTYRKFIDHLLDYNEHLKVIGLTATYYRMGSGLLTDNGIFTDICHDSTSMERFNWYIDEGYLVPVVPKKMHSEIDLSQASLRGGEFVQKDLQLLSDKEEVTYAALRETLDHGHDRKKWLIFTTGIDHSESVAKMLDSFGISAAVVHSKLTDSQRDQILRDFSAGKYRALINTDILTTGFDDPEIDLIVVLRGTNSPGLWVQMLGRGTRPVYETGGLAIDLEVKENRLAAIAASHKQECLVLDFAGNSKRLGPINDPVIPKKRRKGQKSSLSFAPVKVCPKCNAYIAASLRVCSNCGYDIPASVNFASTASTDELIRRDIPQVEIFKVSKVIYNIHNGAHKDKPPSLKVVYHCGLRVFKEYICLEHGGYPTHKAHKWWRIHSTLEPPETVADGLRLTNHLKEPTHIRVHINTKHPKVLDYDFTGKAFE